MKFIKWSVIAVLVGFQFLHGATSEPKKKFRKIFSRTIPSRDDLLKQERTTNLVIINDVYDQISSSFAEVLQMDFGFTMLYDLSASLLDGEHLTLCTKVNWVSMQNLVKFWNDYQTKTLSELVEEIETSFGLLDKMKFKFVKKGTTKEIAQVQQCCQELQKRYDFLQNAINLESSSEKKYEIAQSLVKEFSAKSLFRDLSPENQYFVSQVFAAYVVYQIICAMDYQCFDLHPYILFVPKPSDSYFVINKDDFNLLIGLNLYGTCHVYDYKEMISDIYNNYVILTSTLPQDLGSSLLETLKKLRTSAALYPVDELQPFFNVLLIGHGDNDLAIAGLSIEKTSFFDSDFVKILKYLNTWNIKSLGISSCYSAGKQFLSTFDITNKWNNFTLESLKYPILFIGSFFTTTRTIFKYPAPFSEKNVMFYTNKFLYGPSKESMLGAYFKYFSALNKVPVQFEEAAYAISGIYDVFTKPESELVNKQFLSSWVSIKYPYTSWTEPMLLKSQLHKDLLKARKITQTIAVAQPNMVIDEHQNFIVLQANNINAITIKSLNVVPYLLPMNYMNQNYVINDLDMSNIQVESIYHLMQYLFPIEDILEPVNIVIKNLKCKNKHLKNVYLFSMRSKTFKKYGFLNKEETVSGYMYTDVNDSNKTTYAVTWPVDFTGFDPARPDNETIKIQAFPEAKLKKFIQEVEEKARVGLKDLTAVESFVAKQNLKDDVLKEPVNKQNEQQAQSWVKKEAKWVLQDIVDDVASIEKDVVDLP